ncbi:TPA: hypothetical protein QDZ99_003049 [Stenotrophomonas maltophilia]|nr:hypothetical protein [Stenotrophomonas maltophilia]HDS1158249.1 hypothetical protein [Stenotrophomonas maltophilia]HDS1167714.1 hypothetical protein [Stenotrophomonas maltophilia]HDS1171315.1 hypothetical protein [Stenotrophomonas maltophilia]HDS1177369.1 hypothetical protein [Stenotrophomonas maltophilia]
MGVDAQLYEWNGERYGKRGSPSKSSGSGLHAEEFILNELKKAIKEKNKHSKKRATPDVFSNYKIIISDFPCGEKCDIAFAKISLQLPADFFVLEIADPRDGYWPNGLPVPDPRPVNYTVIYHAGTAYYFENKLDRRPGDFDTHLANSYHSIVVDINK